MEKVNCVIRLLEENDIPQIVRAFAELGWPKPQSQYEHYLMEQKLDMRNVYVAFIGGEFAGYLTICWASTYVPFLDEGIPEIVDFNVLPKFRRQGIGTQLMEEAECAIDRISLFAGIGVGMTPDYGAAQRLYTLRGYVPDGRGLHYHGRPVKYGQGLTVNDDLVLYFVKKLR